jgi:hypothetical protein
METHGRDGPVHPALLRVTRRQCPTALWTAQSPGIAQSAAIDAAERAHRGVLLEAMYVDAEPHRGLRWIALSLAVPHEKIELAQAAKSLAS